MLPSETDQSFLRLHHVGLADLLVGQACASPSWSLVEYDAKGLVIHKDG